MWIKYILDIDIGKRITLYVRYQVSGYIYCVVVPNARAEWRINKNFVEMM